MTSRNIKNIVQFLLDPSVVATVISAVQLDLFTLDDIFSVTRTYCYAIHRRRLQLTGRFKVLWNWHEQLKTCVATLLKKNNGRGKPFCAGGKIFPSWCEKFFELPKKELYPCMQENQSANRWNSVHSWKPFPPWPIMDIHGKCCLGRFKT